MKNLIFILLLAFIKVSISIIISTSYGKLYGKHVGEYHSFKHVPFAKPPIGELRFQKPETVEPWNDVREAVDYGPACMSNSTWTKSPQKWVDEDCLHINIFTSNECLKSKNCPVAVYIHGGELSFDSAVMFNDTFMFDTFVKRDVVLLVPAFRLGIFSHFVVEDQSIAPTNLALYDILKSFEFVKSEVHNFGGDNKKITVFGHSYGGTISSMLTFSTEVNQDLSLFQQSVSMSSNQYFETLELHMERTQRFAKHANCLVDSKQAETMTRNEQDRHTMKCLQAKSGMELLRLQRSLEEAGYSDMKGVVLREPIFQKVSPMELWNSPNKIPMLTGCTKIEFDHEDELLPLAMVIGFDNPKECDEKYRKDLKEGAVDLENHTDKTLAITVPTKMRVNKLLENLIPVYLYEFTYPKHAKHADDLYYIMGVHPFQEDENEIHLKKVYQNMFINFIKYGHPGDGFEISNLKKSSYYDVYWNETTGERPQMRNDFEKKVMDYWLKDMMEYDRKVTEEKKSSLEKPSLRYTKLDLSSSGMDQSSRLLFLIFMKPETADKWKGIRQAKEYGPACMSNSTETSSPQEWIDEDCLHVNIFTSDKCLESKGCAVAVYIHGGDILYDSAVMFNDTILIDSFVKNDVVLVIPGFRLGIFSHFVVDDQSIAPNNVAIYDILKSLDYVQSEIHNFGGNNKNVTMFGHSYGGTIIALLTFSTKINEDLSLFQRAILMSSHQHYDKLEDHIERTQLFAKHANCLIDSKLIKMMTIREKDRHTMKCLQAKSGMELLRIQRLMEEAGYLAYGGLIYREPLFPNVKQSEFWNSPKEIPILTGCIKTEFDFDPEKIPLAESLDFENPDECETKYRNDLRDGKFDRDNHTDRTQLIMVPTKVRVNKLLDKNIPAYLYEFTYPKHARHTDDLYYIMGVHPFQEDENEVHLKKVYQNMFINFIKYGHPGDGFEISNLEKSSYFDVYWNETTGERPQMRNDFEKKVMDYWLKDMMEYDRKITEEKNKRMKKLNLKSIKSDLVSSEIQSSQSAFFSFVIILIFLAGYMAGKCCSSRRDLYIRLDGSNFENVKQFA